MTPILLGFAGFLLLNIFAGLLRVVRGPNPPDRMIAGQLFGTLGVAILLVLAEALERLSLVDVGLVFALLGALAMVTFVSRVWRRLPQAGASR